MNKKIVATLVLAAACASGSSWGQQVKTVAQVDLTRYMGRWYEIARFPNRFQKDCVADVTAEYAKRADGEIDVINRCKNAEGNVEEADGRGRVVDATSNAKLQVKFAPEWLGWLPFVWSGYWIIDLDAGYSLAAVGGPTRDYLWILARTPSVPDAAFEELVNRVTAQGFDTAKLVKTNHELAGN